MVYVLVACAWLYIAPRLHAAILFGNDRLIVDLIFVAVSALLFYVLHRRSIEARSHAPDHSQHLSAELLDSISDGFVALNTDGQFTFVNRRAAEMLNRDAPNLIGKHIWSEFPGYTEEQFEPVFKKAVAEQQPILFEQYYEPWNRWLATHIYPTRSALYLFFQDVTQRKRSDLWRQGQNEVLEAVVSERPLSEILEIAVRAIELQTRGAIGSVLLFDRDRQCLLTGAAPGLPKELNEIIDGLPIGPLEGACGTAAHTRDLVIIEDFETDARGEKYKEILRPFNLRACWSQPIISADDEVLGTFAMYYRSPRRPSAEELLLISDAGKLVSLAIETVRNKAALRASETRFRSTVESAPVGIALVTTAGELLRINRKACEIVGHSHRELQTKGFRGIAHPDDADKDLPLLAQTLSGDIQAYALEKRYVRANGITVWTNLTVSLVHKENGNPDYLIYILEDIGERKLVEQTLQDNRRELESLSRRLLSAQEAERSSIARELHDEIGQMLTIVKFNLQMVLKQDPTPRLATALTEGMSSIDRVVASVRDLSLNLRPSMLDHLGLEATVRWFVKSQQDNLDVQIDLSLPESMPRPSSEVEISCFRILQEAFTNAARYAQASRIEVKLVSRNGAVELVVKDDGKGFDMAAARRRILQGGGAGLLGMTERAELAGGTVSITSSPGQGTRVTASFPESVRAKIA